MTAKNRQKQRTRFGRALSTTFLATLWSCVISMGVTQLAGAQSEPAQVTNPPEADPQEKVEATPIAEAPDTAQTGPDTSEAGTEPENSSDSASEASARDSLDAEAKRDTEEEGQDPSTEDASEPESAEAAVAGGAEDEEADATSTEETVEELNEADLSLTDLPPIDYSLPRNPKFKNFIWPILGTTGINLTFFGFTKIIGAEFSHVGPDNWKENFTTGFQWDDNEFEVNQVGHPYQGGLYFTTGRVHGLSFYQSIPYAMLGSFQWEYFAESESPSTNDWMTTVWGGMFFGEVLYRLSNRMLDDSTSGSNRFWREFGAFAISPVSGFDRLFMGKMWQSGPAGIKPRLDANLKLGVDGVGLSEGTGWGKTFRVKIGFDYGDPYAKPKRRVPFEVFDFAIQVNAGDEILGQSFDGTGVLWGNRVTNGENGERRHLLGWVMDFEYFTNGTTQMFTRESSGIYQLGLMGTGFGWYGQWDLGHNLRIDVRADGLFVPTGSITSPYAKYEANRSYNYAIGAATKAEFSLRHERWGRLYTKAHRYWYQVVDGAIGTELLGVFQAGAYFNIYNGHGIGASALMYDRTSYYKHYDDLKDHFWTGQLQYELEY